MPQKTQDKYTTVFCNNLFCCIVLRAYDTLFLLWRRLWRSTIRGNLKMVITELARRTAVWKVPILRQCVVWRLGRVRQRFPGVLRKFQEPEEEFLSSLLFDDVQFVVVSQCTGHFLVGHVVSVLVVSPETCQSVWVDHPEHQAILVFPSDVLLVPVITQQLIHIVPQQSAVWDAAVRFVQWAPWLLFAGQVEGLLGDALCLGRILNLAVGQCGDYC